MFDDEPLGWNFEDAASHQILSLSFLNDALATDLFNAEEMAAKPVQTGSLAVPASECGLVQLEGGITMDYTLTSGQLVTNTSCAARDTKSGNVDVHHSELSFKCLQCSER